MRLSTLFLLVSLILPSGLRAQNSVPQQPQPLNETEKRLILWQLYELEAARGKIASYEDWIKREQELRDREKIVWQQQIDNEKTATTLAQEKTKLAEDKALFYKQLYESVTAKKHGVGCTIAKVFTLGIYRCK